MTLDQSQLVAVLAAFGYGVFAGFMLGRFCRQSEKMRKQPQGWVYFRNEKPDDGRAVYVMDSSGMISKIEKYNKRVYWWVDSLRVQPNLMLWKYADDEK